jgi:hypothetical protein
MTRVLSLVTSAAIVALTAASTASAGITVTNTTEAAPTYSTVLNFDEAGAPSGELPPSTWQSDFGLTINGGAGNPFVGNLGGIYGPWAGTGNAIVAPFGLFLNFDNDLTEFSFQAWDPSGPPTPFGGGLHVHYFLDGVHLGTQSVTPAWGGVGKTWFNITTTDGSRFDEVRVLGGSFIGSDTIMDNLSWNAVPGPGGLAFLLFGLASRSRRRA